MKAETTSPPDSELEVSLVRGDLLFRAEKAVGLIPRTGAGVLRRTLICCLLAWLPLAVWALVTHRALPGHIAEPLLDHFGIHVRFLLALPALILGEALVQAVTTTLVPHFVRSGIVPEAAVPRFKEAVRSVIRLRDSAAPWMAMAVIMFAWFVVADSGAPAHELIWAQTADAHSPASKSLGFGGWWYLYVARPLFQIFLFAWLWRLVLLTILLRRISKLDLHIAPLHPDGRGGLAFTEGFLKMFSPFAFACSAVLAAHWAHSVAYHGAHAASFKIEAIVFAVAVLLLCVAPLLVFVPVLARTRRKAMLQYGALVGKHSWLVHRRWIVGESVPDSPILEAPELGPAADVNTLYQSVQNMRTLPLSKKGILVLAIALGSPILVVFAMDVPIGELLGKIAKTLL